MDNKNLLYKFEGDDGVNLQPSHVWNDITNSVEVLQKINFLDSSSKVKVIPQVKSIPSPYARMILFKNAFDDDTFPKDLKDMILQDILDAMEFIFLHKATKFDDKLDFVKVKLYEDKKNPKLNSIHRKFVNTLDDLSEKYSLESDKENEKYNAIDVFYLIHSETEKQVIAGTSPYTIFFTPETRINGIQGYFEWEKDITTGKEKRRIKNFDERNKVFLNYLYLLKSELPNSSKGFLKELDKLYRSLGEKFKSFDVDNIITDEIQLNETSDIKKIDIVPGLNFQIFKSNFEVNSYYKLKPAIVPITADNGIFEPPLVLTSNNITEAYYNGIAFGRNWESVFKLAVTTDIERRYLPNSVVKYPWISPIDDFLEPYLIKLPYKINSKEMYDGKNDDSNNFQYLIPLKKDYFKYFKAEEIENFFSFTIISCSDDNINSDQIEVRLRIPVEGNTNGITVKKVYSNRMIEYGSFEQDLSTGQILKQGTFMALWPAIINQGISRYYIINYEHIKRLEDMWNSVKYFFYDSGNNGILTEIRNDAEHYDVLLSVSRDASTRLTSMKYPPELIQMERKSGAKGFFLPKFETINDGVTEKKWYVGIDFGTSNSVVAFCEDKTTNSSTLLPINSKNFISFYHGNKHNKESGEKLFERAVNMFFIPNEFGQYVNNELKGSPFSTEVVYKENERILTHQILHSNITFKRVIPPKEDTYKNGVKTNLKWSSNDDRNKELINLFFKQIKSIVEKYAIENSIPNENIEYIYSYPLAFDADQKSNLKKIFTENNFAFIPPLDESQCSAKFFHQYGGKSFGVNNPTPAITIDIGGGTADIVGYKDGKTMFKNSLLFGGKDIFEDLSKAVDINNPFVLSLRGFLIGLGKKDDSINFVFNETIFSQYTDSHSLFSYIVSKDEFKKALLEIHNTDFYKYFRLTILYFYSSILYFLSQNIKNYYQSNNQSVNDISEIRIGIGGNGSRLLEWLCRGEKWDVFIRTNDTFKQLMEDVFIYGLGIDNKKTFELTIIQSPFPKEEVVRGLLIKNDDADKISSKTENELICSETLNINSEQVSVFDNYRSINRGNYAQVKYSDFESSEINKFNSLFMSLLSQYKTKIDNDIKLVYIDNFLEVFNQFTKDKIMAQTRNIIDNYFASKDITMTEYINSFFITEVKACLDLIKGQLSEKYLKNKI